MFTDRTNDGGLTAKNAHLASRRLPLNLRYVELNQMLQHAVRDRQAQAVRLAGIRGILRFGTLGVDADQLAEPGSLGLGRSRDQPAGFRQEMRLRTCASL